MAVTPPPWCPASYRVAVGSRAGDAIPDRYVVTTAGRIVWKVAIFLEELNITYNTVYKVYGDGADGVKHPDFLKINPNGRIPAIVDHANGDFILWESAAIIEYLVDRYDTKGIFRVNGNDGYMVSQWLAYQISGQGPMFGQATWFSTSHSEKVGSVIERYSNEMKRILGVLELGLATSTGRYLVGDRLTIADLAFVPWNMTAIKYLPHLGLDGQKDIPNLITWHGECAARPSVKKVYALRDQLRAEQQKQNYRSIS